MSKDAYQSITTYSGDLYGIKPSYQGIEYDFEVPSNLVVASPGGVDSRTGHYTKGFYGRGNSSSDVYAGQGPQYIDGVYGNLYQSGQTSSQAMGYYPANQDYQFYQNYTPQEYIKDPTSIGYEASWMPEKRLHEGADPPHNISFTSSNQNLSIKEGFERVADDSFEVIGETSPAMHTQNIESFETSGEIIIPVYSNSWFWLMLGIMLFSLFIFMWVQSARGFIVEKFNKSNNLSWALYGFWSVVVFVILAFMIWAQGIILK